MSTPEPNSPEALKQARRVRDLFILIAVLNIVGIALVFYFRQNEDKEKQDKPPQQAPQQTPKPAGAS